MDAHPSARRPLDFFFSYFIRLPSIKDGDQ